MFLTSHFLRVNIPLPIDVSIMDLILIIMRQLNLIFVITSRAFLIFAMFFLLILTALFGRAGAYAHS